MNPSQLLIAKGKQMKFRLSNSRFKRSNKGFNVYSRIGHYGVFFQKRNFFKLRLFERLRLYMKRYYRSSIIRWRF